MGLQVRVRHALGERLIDLDDRSADNPLIVGRSKDADVKIPSVAVASRHSALFVHEGRWLVQDLSKGATFLNGNIAKRPTPLSVGDVLTLGNDASPATIEIDPSGSAAGQTGEPALTTVPAPAIRPRTAPAPRAAPPPPRTFQSPAPSAPRATPPQIARPAPAPTPAPAADDAWGDQSAPSDDPFAGWQPAAPASAHDGTTTPRRRRKKQSSTAGLTVGILVCILIVAGTIWAVRYETRSQTPPQSKAVPPSSGPHKALGNMFTGVDSDEPAPTAPKSSASHSNEGIARSMPQAQAGTGTKPGGAAPTVTLSAEPARTTSPSNAGASPDDPKADDKVWNDVLAATFSPDIGQAILKFDDYRRQHPGVATKELDQYTDEAMDRLWWKRITQLCNRRDAKTKELRAKEKELKEQPEGAFKKTLMDERKVIQDDLDHAQERLASDMGYTNSDVPDIDNKDLMAKLTNDRDASKYGAWKLSTIKYIRNTHGSTPWDGEN